MAGSKRLKSDRTELLTINGWEQADELIKEISRLKMKISCAEDLSTKKIAIVKTEMVEAVENTQKEINLLLASIEAFATQHKTEFGGQKTRKLNFGLLGWRKSTVTIITKKTLEFIKQFLPAKLQKELIRIKESVNKEAVGQLTEEQLADIEARREEKEVFFVEPNSVEAADYEKGKS